MGLLGGVVGVVFGWLIGRALTFGTNLIWRDSSFLRLTCLPCRWWMVGAAIAILSRVSLAAGIYPAARAARLNPVEALRYE